VGEIRSPDLCRLRDDWEARRRGRDMPSRADFDVLDLKYIIGKIVLFDVAYDPLRFRCRLHGTAIARRVGYEMTGKSLDDIPSPALRAKMHAHFARVVEGRVPVVEMRERETLEEGTVDCEVLILPLSGDGKTVDMLMVGMIFS
jgi:hypothetical protein